jgi:hypothetical protein
MKMRRRLPVGVVLAAMVVSLAATVADAQVAPSATPTFTPTATPTATATPTSTSGSPACSPAWVPSTVYIAGNKVSRTCAGLTQNFEAAFFSQNSDPCTFSGPPGGFQPWMIRGICDGGPPTPSPTATVTATATTPPAWEPYLVYGVGAKVSYGGALYRCIQAHQSLPGWEPPATPALWERL